MKSSITRKEALEQIESFFRQTGKLDPAEVRKIKRLAMHHKIRLKAYRKRFCKKCYSDLREGKIRITKHYKMITCKKCDVVNKWKVT